MRTDIKIDRKQVYCPNASHLGFDKWRAQVGDICLFHHGDPGTVVTGRMIGRIAYAPEPELIGHIVMICLSDDLTYTFERWVNPEFVTRIQALDPARHRSIVESFLSDEMAKRPVEKTRSAVEFGGTLGSYQTWMDKRDADMAEYESRAICDCNRGNRVMKGKDVCVHCSIESRVTTEVTK